MKKLLLSLILALGVLPVFSQMPDTLPWCPPGATWIYQYRTMFSTNFCVIKYAGDTLIQNHAAKKISRASLAYLGIVQGEGRVLSQDVVTDYWYNSNDSIFFWDSGNFKFMYNFNAAVGDTFLLSNSNEQCLWNPDYPDSSTVVVTSVASYTIGSRIFDAVFTSYNDSFQIGTILRNIGSTLSPLPQINPGPCASGVIDGGIMGFQNLECYFDSLRGDFAFNNRPYQPCFGLRTSLEAAVKRQVISIYPNPVEHLLEIKGLPAARYGYTVYDIRGTQALSGEWLGQELEVGSLVPGVYILELKDQTQSAMFARFIKQ